MNKTAIEYLDFSWNPTHGCSPISLGCNHCWAKATSKRLAGMGVRGYSKDDPFAVTCCPWKLDEPLKVKKPSRIGVSFMGDLFHDKIPDYFIANVWDTILKCPQHTFMILTKRPERAKKLIGKSTNNIWLGVTVESDKYLWRIDELLKIPTAKHFVSLEPLLGAVDISPYLKKNELINYDHPCHLSGITESYRPALNQVIIGAESGANRRYMDMFWAIDVVKQCKAAGVPVFVKQIHLLYKKSRRKYGTILSKDPSEWPEDLRIREYPC